MRKMIETFRWKWFKNKDLDDDFKGLIEKNGFYCLKKEFWQNCETFAAKKAYNWEFNGPQQMANYWQEHV
jgi:hypothetical protein